MYTFPVAKLYEADAVLRNGPAAARARRLMAAWGVVNPVVISKSAAQDLAAKRPTAAPAPYPRRTGSFDYSRGWTVLLDTYADGDQMGAGISRTTYRDASKTFPGAGVCQSALELHAAFGCYHRCAYCFCDPFFHIACDLESLADSVPAYLSQHPGQQLFKFDNFTDTIVLEPEYGASELLVPLFAKTPDRFLLLYTKSDNVDHLLSLPHGGHTIVNWSLSPPTQSRTVELNTPDTFARIAAMRKCQEAGYTVRVRISPLVPLEGWRADFEQMADALFAAVRPDVVTVDILGWCLPEALADAMDVSRLEEPWRLELEAMMGKGNRSAGKYLFSHGLRSSALRFAVEAIRRRSPETPVVICNETEEMWKALGDILWGRPGRYACCCGPTSVPGNPLMRQGKKASVTT
jgi:spore photoproduct lyase